MSRRVLRLVTALAVAGGAAVGFVPLAGAAPLSEVPSATVRPSAEAWYQPNPTCDTPLGCLALPALPPPLTLPTSLYPAGSLHVGVLAGAETARSYLAYDLAGLTGTVTGARLDVPLDSAPQGGSLSPETATAQVCLFDGTLTAVEGSFESPPRALCLRSAPLAYVATPTPHLHADLGPLARDLAGASGLVLLPDATQVAPTDAWHLVFSRTGRTDAGATPPAVLTLALAPVPVVQPPGVPAAPQAPVPAGNAPPLGTSSGPELPAVTAAQVPRVDAGPAPVAVVPQAGTIRVGYAYPVVWLLPLVLLVLVPATARSLTADLTAP